MGGISAEVFRTILMVLLPLVTGCKSSADDADDLNASFIVPYGVGDEKKGASIGFAYGLPTLFFTNLRSGPR